jgi:hypothetical protein
MNGLPGWFAEKELRVGAGSCSRKKFDLGRIKPERSREKKSWLAKYL